MFRVFVSAFFVATLAYEGLTYLLWFYENRVHGRGLPRGPSLSYVTSWIADWGALTFLLCAFPLRWLHLPPGGPPARSSRPVMLVHGWGLTGGAMALLASRLRRDGREVRTVRYPSNAADVEVSAAVLAAAIHKLAAGNGSGRRSSTWSRTAEEGSWYARRRGEAAPSCSAMSSLSAARIKAAHWPR